MRAGIEIGGTFTDIVLVDDEGRVLTHKVPSTPDDPSVGAIEGLMQILDREHIRIDSLDELFHGSTIATNTLLERKGAGTALLTTAGFEDVLIIGRQDKTRVYDLFYRKPQPLIRREHVFGVRERVAATGEVVERLEAAEIDGVIDRVLEVQGIESVAVCFINAYLEPRHEVAVKKRLATRAPHLAVSLSSEIAPEFREYERTSTVSIASYVKPRVSRYLARLDEEVRKRGFKGALLIMQSNGGVVPAARAAENPAKMFLSGPAAGVTGACDVLSGLGMRNALTIDIGGTSCDACVLTNGAPQNTQRGYAEYRIDGLPISLMMVDIATLGAGGGSIAWIDAGGGLQVGPKSAGAKPGPACYGLGGTAFTLSDALLLLGMIDPNGFIGGRMKLDPSKAEEAAKPLAERLGMTTQALADAVRRITVGNIAPALRLVTVKRGYDPRDFVLFAYGGAGPVMAASIADEMGIDKVVVPPAPGIFSAYGLSVADTKVDYVRSMPGTFVGSGDSAAVVGAFDGMTRQALSDFERFGVEPKDVVFAHSIDARYVGQGYELPLLINPHAVARDGLKVVADGFHAAHDARYGHHFADQGVEIVGCRTVATTSRRTAVRRVDPGEAAPARMSEIVFDRRAMSARVVSRAGLAAEAQLLGPAMVVEASSATIVPPGWSASLLAGGVLLLSRAGA